MGALVQQATSRGGGVLEERVGVGKALLVRRALVAVLVKVKVVVERRGAIKSQMATTNSFGLPTRAMCRRLCSRDGGGGAVDRCVSHGWNGRRAAGQWSGQTLFVGFTGNAEAGLG